MRKFDLKKPLIVCFAIALMQAVSHNGHTQQAEVDTTGKTPTFHFMGVGDIMLGTNFPDSSYLPPYGPEPLLEPVKHILKKADLTFGNLEGTLMDTGKLVKDCEVDSLCYAFRMPSDYVNALKSAGFDLISLANNHSGDFGTQGRKNTIRTLDSAGIKSAGVNLLKTTTIELKGKTIGFVAFSPNNGTPRIEKIPKAKRLVEKLDREADIIIVSFHGGAEGDEHQHVPRKVEEYYGENRGDVYKFSHEMINSGADVVFGHGPHVPRAMELYKNRIIAYSLGNFCTYARFKVSGVNGLAPILSVKTDENGEFLGGRIIHARQTGEGGLKLDGTGASIRKIKELTREDFPETPLLIKDDGTLVNTNDRQ